MYLLNLKKVLVYKCYLTDGNYNKAIYEDNTVKALFINKRQESVCISRCNNNAYVDLYSNGKMIKCYAVQNNKLVHDPDIYCEFVCLSDRKSQPDMC